MLIFILLYLALTIVRPQDYMPGLTGLPILSVVLLLAFFSWLLSSAKTFAAPQFMILPVFLLAMMMSQVAAGWAGGALEVLSAFGPTMIAFFVLATVTANSPRRIATTFAVFVLCACVLALHGVDQSLNGIGWTGVGMAEDGRIQYVGIFNDPNDLGLLFAAVLPMACFLSGRGGFLRRIFWLAAAGLLLYGVYLTNSRGAFLAVLAIGGAYVWYKRGIVTAGILGSVGLVAMQLLSSRMQELDADESSAAGRVDAWYEGLHMFLSHPLFGVGAGNFTEYNYLTAHNSFVLVLAETGFFGFITWLAFVGYGFWMMLKVLRSPPQPAAEGVVGAWADERTLALTLLLSQLGLFAAAFFLSRSYTVVMYLLIAVLVGYYVGVRKRYPSLPSFSLAEGWWRWIPIALGSIFALFVIVEVLMHTS
ncbi:O-antigen polymerase family protein [Rhodanobacter fulvus Jip2]|jgi:O-antigen ligase|uniref:O-antigen polymerase family protein n=1 Tax=Rhodanobacter fulvus Jip2 TaxID=1163408 RepID=I4VVU2_9GAMM|nr:O-antigen ligase family protein [Rhodanobacter fulvus]EIL91333.1 O-antigen polymerase family protein [Rhodanobacter fulvus Jip2]